MQLDPLLEQELARILATPCRSDFENQVYLDIMNWWYDKEVQTRETIDFTSFEDLVNAFWKEKLA